MKLRLLILLLFTGATWAGTNLFGAHPARTGYEALVARLDGINGIAATVESYQSGLLDSEAVTLIRYPDTAGHEPGAETPDRPAGDTLIFRLHHVIDHAPLSLSDDGLPVAHIITTLLSDGASEKVRHFAAAFADGAPFVLDSQLGVDGSIVHRLDVATAEWGLPERRGHFAGARYQIEQPPAGGFHGTARIGGGSFPLQRRGQLELGASEQVFSGETAADGALLAQQSLTTEQLQLRDVAPRTAMQADDLTLDLDLRLLASMLDIGLGLHSDALATPLPFAQLDLTLRASDLSTAAITHRQRTDTARATGAATPDSPAAFSWQQIRRMLVPGSATAIDLNLGNDRGRLQAVADLELRHDSPDGKHRDRPARGRLLPALKGALSLTADADTFDGTRFATLLSSPLLAPAVSFDGDTYRSDWTLGNRQLKVNGQTVPLPRLLAEVLDRPL